MLPPHLKLRRGERHQIGVFCQSVHQTINAPLLQHGGALPGIPALLYTARNSPSFMRASAFQSSLMDVTQLHAAECWLSGEGQAHGGAYIFSSSLFMAHRPVYQRVQRAVRVSLRKVAPRTVHSPPPAISATPPANPEPASEDKSHARPAFIRSTGRPCPLREIDPDHRCEIKPFLRTIVTAPAYRHLHGSHCSDCPVRERKYRPFPATACALTRLKRLADEG
ncbi:hypothetical protein KCP69_09980 [Salmonella enterica subsp. enterica]|nr:hypothetical protein KCP69_09980 [Salmonella enterica subsp. enterica]